MKLLLDENISFRLLKSLESLFPGSRHVLDIKPALQSDHAIWDYAKAHTFVIVTFDTDFVQIAALRGNQPKVLLLALKDQRHARIADLLREQFGKLEEFIADNASDAPGVLEITDR